MHPSQSSATSFICQHPRDTAGPELSATEPHLSGPLLLQHGKYSSPKDREDLVIGATAAKLDGPLQLRICNYTHPTDTAALDHGATAG